MTDVGKSDRVLGLLDDLVVEGRRSFTFSEARARLGSPSPGDAGNVLARAVRMGLLDRTRRGCYVVRDLGVLGSRAAADDLASVISSAFIGVEHRIAYATALEEHDLVSRPSRTIFVASARRMRVAGLSGRPLRTVSEPEGSIGVGAMGFGPTRMSGIERSLLDAAARPSLVGGAGVIAEALVAAGKRIDPGNLVRQSAELGWSTALRRIGSLMDVLGIELMEGTVAPPGAMAADIDLEPGSGSRAVWRDPKWKVRWSCKAEEMIEVAGR